MSRGRATFHILSVGWSLPLVEKLFDQVAATCDIRFSHLLHPRHTADTAQGHESRSDVFFFRARLRQPMPEPDIDLLESLEQDGVPTIHNMILGDRVVCDLDYRVALAYATFLAQRLMEVFDELRPSVIVGNFDSLHAGLALAVAKRLGVPWFALGFSVIPPGLACFWYGMLPTTRLRLAAQSPTDLKLLAEKSLAQFENKSIDVPAYITPPALSVSGELKRLPKRFVKLVRTIRKGRDREYHQFTEHCTDYSVRAAFKQLRQVGTARKVASAKQFYLQVPSTPYVLFGLHMQPESSVDVWAPFFSNQLRVIELLSRSVPPSHKLLIKIHKSDAAKYSSVQLERMRSFPGVELIQPFADSRSFVEGAKLIVAIQGTMGLEGALLGKPVIMLGESPVVLFPSASGVGQIVDLPQLIRKKLKESPPSRTEIVDAYASYLDPFVPASHNDWTAKITAREMDGYRKLFDMLKCHVVARSAAS